MIRSKRIVCLACGFRHHVVLDSYAYGVCPVCRESAFECSATGGCLRCQGVKESLETAAFTVAEIKYDAQQLERATYHGMTEEEFMERYPDGEPYPTTWPDPEPDTCDGYVSDGEFSCICARCVEASEPPQPVISPEATIRPFWRLKVPVVSSPTLARLISSRGHRGPGCSNVSRAPCHARLSLSSHEQREHVPATPSVTPHELRNLVHRFGHTHHRIDRPPRVPPHASSRVRVRQVCGQSSGGSPQFHRSDVTPRNVSTGAGSALAIDCGAR